MAATRASACEYVRQGGTIVHIGLGEATGGLDIRRMTLQEIRFIGTYTYTAQDFRDTAAAIFDGRLGALDGLEVINLASALDHLLDGSWPSLVRAVFTYPASAAATPAAWPIPMQDA